MRSGLPAAEEYLFRWDDLPFITPDLPGTGGQIRAEADDFRVTELPLYLPSGKGSHRYLLVKKRDLTTRDLIQALTRGGAEERSVGAAGLKDKHAVTVQWLSIPKRVEGAVNELEALKGVTILEESYHKNKLGIGHLRGNRFEITVRNAAPDAAALATETLAALKQRGAPNWFGPQRFGRYGTNAYDGLRVIRGEAVPGGHRLHRFFISALQSLLFNDLLARRVRRGWYEELIDGDWARKHDTGGTFLVEDAALEAPRARRLEVSATLPLFGRKVKRSPARAGDVEEEALSALKLRWSDFSSRTGDRRITRLLLEDAASRESAQGDALQLDFTLPKGSYATAVLREVMKVDVDAPDPPPEGFAASGAQGEP